MHSPYWMTNKYAQYCHLTLKASSGVAPSCDRECWLHTSLTLQSPKSRTGSHKVNNKCVSYIHTSAMAFLGHVAKEVKTSETSDTRFHLRKRICQSTRKLGTVVRIVTRPWARRTWGSNPGKGKRFLSSPRQAQGPTQPHIQ